MNPSQTKHVIGIVIGSLLLVASLIVSRMLYVSGMQRAYDTLGSPGSTDPTRLSGDISAVLYACAGGILGSVIGLVVLIVSVVHFVRARRRLSASDTKSNETGIA